MLEALALLKENTTSSAVTSVPSVNFASLRVTVHNLPEIDTDAAAGEHEAFFLGEDLSCSEPLVCDSSLEDALIEAEEEYNVK